MSLSTYLCSWGQRVITYLVTRLAWVDHFIWLFKSSQLSSTRLQSTLVWLFKSSQPTQHVFSQHWFDCSGQASSAQHIFSQASSARLQSTLVWLFKSSQINSARLHLIPCVLYGRSMRLDSTRLVRMSCSLVYTRPYRKQATNERLWITI